MCMCVYLSVYLYTLMCADAQRGQKRALDLLKLELQAVMSRYVREGGGRKEKAFRLYHQASDPAFYPRARSMPPCLLSGF